MLPSVTENSIYRDDPLLRMLADAYGTPFYVFDEALIRAKCRALLADVTYRPFNPRYALKALTLRGILEVIRDGGYWADAASVNEVKRACGQDSLRTRSIAQAKAVATLITDGWLIKASSSIVPRSIKFGASRG